jgi:hypothetical protein
MSQSFENLAALSDQITDLTDHDLNRLARLIVRQSPDAACDLLDGMQAEFLLIERELGLV